MAEVEQAASRPKQANPEASPINGVVPPKEHRWKKGQSGNPRGRLILDPLVRKLKADEARQERIVEMWLQDAEDPDNPMVRRFARNDMLDRIVGKPAQSLTLSLDDEEEVEWA